MKAPGDIRVGDIRVWSLCEMVMGTVIRAAAGVRPPCQPGEVFVGSGLDSASSGAATGLAGVSAKDGRRNAAIRNCWIGDIGVGEWRSYGRNGRPAAL